VPSLGDHSLKADDGRGSPSKIPRIRVDEPAREEARAKAMNLLKNVEAARLEHKKMSKKIFKKPPKSESRLPV
jgi:hypothetical protein